MNTENEEVIVVKDAFNNILTTGDSVTITKDLKVKGNGTTLKKGTKFKNIRTTDDVEEIECNYEGIKGLVLRTEFCKKLN